MSSKDYFDKVSNQWDMMRKSFFPDSIREIAISKACVKKGETAADIGAGTGFITEELIKKGANIIAIDQSESMIEEMKKKFDNYPDIDYRIGDSTNLPIESSSIDYVFANMYLHHVEDPAAAIKEMTRILKPGGKLIITDSDEHNLEFLRTEQFDRWLGFRRDDIHNWYKEAGLKEISVDDTKQVCSCKCQTAENNISIFIAIGTK